MADVPQLTYFYSLSSDFNHNLKMDQLHKEIVESAISSTLIRINGGGDQISITFDSTLSPTDETTLNTLVSNHSPEFNKFIFSHITPITSRPSTDDNSYIEVGLFNYRPSTMGLINGIELVAKANERIEYYGVRVIDLNLGNIILEKEGFNNYKYQTIIISDPINIPTIPTILSVQISSNGKRKTKKDPVYVDSIRLYHGNR